jgi:UDP-N-acetylglucosamine 2-epimerase (non-hydrolysing)
MARIVHVVGARPNFMKVAPVMAALRAFPGIEQRLVHTGQHYDDRMARIFFDELVLPRPDRDLQVGSGSHAQQTAAVLVRFEAVLEEERPDLVVVVGDVNSTLAAALAAAKLGIVVAHVEAGLRSHDRSMPEEINRVLTDRLSTLLFAPDEDAAANLRREGVAEAAVHVVGNVMLDTLAAHRDRLAWPVAGLDVGVEAGRYAVLTLHRAATVDDAERLRRLIARLEPVAAAMPVVFPVHPRTRARLAAAGTPLPDGVRPIEPLGYTAFLSLMAHAACVITDSGGIQEETSALGIPCFTVRDTTEWPRTLTRGTNTLVGRDASGLAAAVDALGSNARRPRPAVYDDARAGERIAAILGRHLGAAGGSGAQ